MPTRVKPTKQRGFVRISRDVVRQRDPFYGLKLTDFVQTRRGKEMRGRIVESRVAFRVAVGNETHWILASDLEKASAPLDADSESLGRGA